MAKVLFYGAGVLGALTIHYLCAAGNDVTVVARSSYEALKRDGVVVRHVLQRKTTVDRPRVVREPDFDERYDAVFSVMQAQQQLAVADALAAVNAPLVILIGNEIAPDGVERKILSKAASPRRVLFGFQNSAGHREDGVAVCARTPVTEIVLGGLHGVANAEERALVEKLFDTRGCRLTWVADMSAYYLCHMAEILPFGYLCYRLDCRMKDAKGADVRALMEASREAFQYLMCIGVKPMPPGEEQFYLGGAKTAGMRLLYRVICRTFLGKLMVSDHCGNAVTEMEQIDAAFARLRRERPGAPMPAWDALRAAMPDWVELHRRWDH
ncbi:MAG: ketopantoate reductase family protein [Clostridia bacterium]|nr:ketopantoate reductase family protein [Clostridia bacterium]